MKRPVCSTFSLLVMIILAACTSTTPVPAPSVEVIRPSSTVPPPTRPPSVATITFEPDACQYDGPQKLPVADRLIITWRIKTKGGDVYALTPFITDEQRNREDLISSLQGLDIHRPALPAGLTSAGTTLGLAGGNLNVTVRTASGPLHGWLYFSCWAAGEAYEVLGPIELK